MEQNLDYSKEYVETLLEGKNVERHTTNIPIESNIVVKTPEAAIDALSAYANSHPKADNNEVVNALASGFSERLRRDDEAMLKVIAHMPEAFKLADSKENSLFQEKAFEQTPATLSEIVQVDHSLFAKEKSREIVETIFNNKILSEKLLDSIERSPALTENVLKNETEYAIDVGLKKFIEKPSGDSIDILSSYLLKSQSYHDFVENRAQEELHFDEKAQEEFEKQSPAVLFNEKIYDETFVKQMLEAEKLTTAKLADSPQQSLLEYMKQNEERYESIRPIVAEIEEPVLKQALNVKGNEKQAYLEMAEIGIREKVEEKGEDLGYLNIRYHSKDIEDDQKTLYKAIKGSDCEEIKLNMQRNEIEAAKKDMIDLVHSLKDNHALTEEMHSALISEIEGISSIGIASEKRDEKEVEADIKTIQNATAQLRVVSYEVSSLEYDNENMKAYGGKRKHYELGEEQISAVLGTDKEKFNEVVYEIRDLDEEVLESARNHSSQRTEREYEQRDL